MKLYEIYPEAQLLGVADCDVLGVCDDSREFRAGYIFVCIEGEVFDGHSFAQEAVRLGAAAVVVQKGNDIATKFTANSSSISKIIEVEDSRRTLALFAKRFYRNPTEHLHLIAVTGTNGKSTTISLIQHILTGFGKKCGSIGTIGYDTCRDDGEVYPSVLTTPRATDLYRYFREMADNGAEYCVIEASSQALAQHRFSDERFFCGIFTNLTVDHLDYHGTIDRYYKAKRSLFDCCENAVVNFDDSYGKKLVKYLEKQSIPTTTYSTENAANYFAVNVKSRGGGVSYWLCSEGEQQSFPVRLKMPGVYNVGNSIAAIAAARMCPLDEKNTLPHCVEQVESCLGVRGRCEVIYDGDFTVITDYAHTADALEKFLTSVDEYCEGRIICLFGAAGERDPSKRPDMGRVVARLADFVVVTSDNPRFEDPQAIIDEVVSGIEDTPFVSEVDREKAIGIALAEAKKGDIVLLCGKGHERYQVIGNEKIPFCERDIVRGLI